MFYQPLQEKAIDPTKLVQKKLDCVKQGLQCIICVYSEQVEDWVKTPRYLSLVKYLDDHAIFSFSSKRVPCFSILDLDLETIIPVDSDLKIKEESPKKDNLRKEYVLGLTHGKDENLVEMPNNSSTQEFLTNLKKSKDLHSQFAGLVEASTFSWVTAFQPRDEFKDSKTLQQKPFNDGQTNKSSSMTSSSSGGFEDNFNDVIKASLKSKSASRDSLDNLDRDSDFGNSLDDFQQELGRQDKPCSDKSSSLSLREEFVRSYMKKREDEYTNLQPLKIFCGTWNVNGQSPTESLAPWLCCDEDPPDIYALGFQELDLSNQAYIFSDSSKDTMWQNAVRTQLHPKAKYRKIKSIRLVGVMLLVYINEKYVDYVSLIDAAYVPTGIMGIMGNKGGVSVRFKIHNTTLSFTNSHLAAHQEEFERRNQDYRDIISRTRYKTFAPFTIQENDLIFWIGDLNYRISNLNIDEVKLYIEQGLYDKLLPHDQLISQLGKSDIFEGFTEGYITFPPTYKYDTGTNNWDTSEKCRMPAWCDRVLYQGPGIRQLRYNSHQSLCVSDHKPVSALHECNVKVVDVKKHKKVYEDVMKKLDRIENDYLPQVKLSCTEFQFKDVKFLEPRSDKLIVSNIGQEPVTIEFIKKLDDENISKIWLQVTPSKKVILAGDEIEIQIEIYVDKLSACRLNSGLDTLDDILVLHLHGGKDFFVPVSGNYLPSSFGSSIEALIQMHGPIRELQIPKLIEIEKPGSLENLDKDFTGGRLYMVPKEIYRLVNHIYHNGIKEENLFQQPGLNAEIQLIRECLDTGVPEILPGTVHSVAESLLLFLECLPESVIPSKVFQKCLDSSNNFLLSKQCLREIPEYHRNVFKYLSAFLREALKFSDDNGLDIKFLSALFGDILLRSPNSSTNGNKKLRRVEEEKKAAFLYHFLSNEYDD